MQNLYPMEPELQRAWNSVRSKLEQAKVHLSTAGCVVKKPTSASREEVWVCRFRQRIDGRVRHRSIYIGCTALAQLARQLIHGWRAPSPEESRRATLLRLWDRTAHDRGYSRRARQRLRASAEEVLGDRRKELRFAFSLRDDDSAIRWGKRPGPRPRGALW